jgi:hypothetical protein
MKRTLMTVSFLAFSLQVFAADREDGTCRAPEAPQLVAPSCLYSKNVIACPPPRSITYCGATPIDASVECRSFDGRLICAAYPTSEQGIFTYYWTFSRNQSVVQEGFAGPQMEGSCEDEGLAGYSIIVIVGDIFGRSETVQTDVSCNLGNDF